MIQRVFTLGAVVLLVALPGIAQKGAEVPESHCDPSYVTDIGPAFPGQPDGTLQFVSGDCTATSGCEDYFDITCAGGETVFASFCAGGTTASFDTGLSSWSGPPTFPTQEFCNDDTCGLLSEMSWVVPVAGTFRIRVGGFGGGSGTYTLGVMAPSTCTIEGAIPVELTAFEVE